MMKEQPDQARMLAILTASDHERATGAYRRVARTTHPDLSRDPYAAHSLATLTAAYRLGDAAAHPTPQVRALLGGPVHAPEHRLGRTRPQRFSGVAQRLPTGVSDHPVVVDGAVLFHPDDVAVVDA